MLGTKRARCAIVIDCDEEMQDVLSTVTAPNDGNIGKYHSYSHTVISSDKSFPNHIGEALHGPDKIASDGLLQDINIQSVSKGPAILSKDRCQDVGHFFSPLFLKEGKSYRNCSLCS
jgi:hypothetical protein